MTGTNNNQIAEDTKLNLELGMEVATGHRVFGRLRAVVLMGGCFSPGQTVSAAEAMRAHVKQKAPKLSDYLVLENQSVTTRENIIFGMRLLNRSGLVGELDYLDLQHVFVSQRLQNWGFRILLWRLYKVKPWHVHSCPTGQRAGWKGQLGRVARLLLYVVDPRQNSRAGKQEAERRRALAGNSEGGLHGQAS